MPAQAQPADINFDSFHDQLNNYGDWLYSDRWGEVWRPWQQDQSADWRPYSVGHWVYTSEYGWTWISDEGPWGDIAYHYGRWVNDPDDGWLWLTGYVWSPAWVVWRSAGPNVGWMPMPPDDNFLGVSAPGLSVNVSFGDWGDTGGFYGYARWYGPSFDENRFGSLWTFVPSAHVADPVYRNYVVPRPQVVNIVRVSHNVTNYTVVNNVIINKSVNITMVQGAGGKPIVPVHAAAVLKTTRWVAPVTRGQQVQAQMRQVHPRGNGQANSAPQPTPQQIRTLSPQPKGRPLAAGGAPHHLFSQANVAQIQARKPAGTPGNAPANKPANKPTNVPANAPGKPAPNTAPRDNAMQHQDLARPATPPRPNEAVTAPAHDVQQRPDHVTPPPRPNDAVAAPAHDVQQRLDHVTPPPRPNEAVTAPAHDVQQRPDHLSAPPPPRPAPVEAKPQRPAEPPRQVPPRPIQPQPAAHPQPSHEADHDGSKPEHHDDDHKQDH
jgi:hypothetical protein